MNDKLNPKILEQWIANTLEDAKYLDIPGLILYPEHKEPMVRHNIDRLSLSKMGLGKDEVERIYKGLFVYSIGFNELLRSVSRELEHAFIIQCTVWKVYSILLEYC